MKVIKCLNCGWEKPYRGGRKRKKCPNCGSTDLAVEEKKEFENENVKSIEKEIEEINQQIESNELIVSDNKNIVDEKEIQKMANQFFRVQEKMDFDINGINQSSSYYPLVKTLVEFAYKPKELRDFKPNDRVIKLFSEQLELAYPESRVSDPRIALILLGAMIFLPAGVYYGNEILKKLRLFRKNKQNQGESEENKQNQETNQMVSKQNQEKEFNILDIK